MSQRLYALYPAITLEKLARYARYVYHKGDGTTYGDVDNTEQNKKNRHQTNSNTQRYQEITATIVIAVTNNKSNSNRQGQHICIEYRKKTKNVEWLTKKARSTMV